MQDGNTVLKDEEMIDESFNVEITVKFKDSESRTIRRFSVDFLAKVAGSDFAQIFVRECSNGAMTCARDVLKKEEMI